MESVSKLNSSSRSERLNLGRREVLVGGMLAAGGLTVGLVGTRAAHAMEASKSGNSHNTTPNQYVEVAGAKFAYRRFGKKDGTPIVLLQHFIGTMDWWDPALTDGLAQERPVILFDNRGVGLSSGETPTSFEAMAQDAAAFIGALGLKKVDLLGFSIGGFIAQELVLARPDLVRKVILAGTGPRGGQDMQEPSPAVMAAVSVPHPIKNRPFLFFSASTKSQSAAKSFMERTAQRTVDLDPESSMQTMQAQGQAMQAWGLADSNTAYIQRLKSFQPPALVVNGSNDIMVPTINSYALAQALPNAELIIYPDSGHGSIFQFAGLFVQHASLFLNRDDQ
jgi:pimeloyl-ACP methyl ester carboxylesterase